MPGRIIQDSKSVVVEGFGRYVLTAAADWSRSRKGGS
jgi:hypothetical protein